MTEHDKGHAGELVAFGRAVRRETPWPIPLWQQVQAMRIAFKVEELLHRRKCSGSNLVADKQSE